MHLLAVLRVALQEGADGHGMEGTEKSGGSVATAWWSTILRGEASASAGPTSDMTAWHA